VTRDTVEAGGVAADTRCVLRAVHSEAEPLWSLGDKLILGLIVLVMLGSSAGVFLGLIQ